MPVVLKIMNKVLEENYIDTARPGSLAGPKNFYRSFKERGVNLEFKEVKNWLKTQDSYTLHRPARKTYKRNKVYSNGIDDVWQMDLVDMTKFSKNNKGFKFLITCLDVFSKHAWVVPIKNKSAEETLAGFKIILNNKRIPNKLHTDKGKEFFNRKMRAFLSEKDILIYAVNSEMKASVVERFNRTLKDRMWRYFTLKRSNVYINVLANLVKSYNNSFHRTIKMKPTEVTSKNENVIMNAMYPHRNEINENFKFHVGDTVRISKVKRTFEKGYTPNWTEEVFVITKRIPRIPVVYTLKDLNNEDIEGIFYTEELQQVSTE